MQGIKQDLSLVQTAHRTNEFFVPLAPFKMCPSVIVDTGEFGKRYSHTFDRAQPHHFESFGLSKRLKKRQR